MTPIDIPKWALREQDEYHSVNLDACVWEEEHGYICSTEVYQGPHICLNSDQGKCHYNLEPHWSKESQVVVIHSNCLCIRRFCRKFLVNFFYPVENYPNVNLCLCFVLVVQGCDVMFTSEKLNVQTITKAYQLYRHVDPTNIGVNIDALQQWIQHPELEAIVKDLEKEGKSLLISVHHSTAQIERVLKRVVKCWNFAHWWETLFATSTELSQTWHILLHPFLVILII